MPGKGWFVILRLYSPLEPFFAKTWRPSEIVLVTRDASLGQGSKAQRAALARDAR